MVKHIQELAKTSHKFFGSRHFTLAGVDNNHLIPDCTFGCSKHWTEISRKRTSRPTFPHNYTLSENYMHLLAPHENKHPF